jgi:hypothetical protein
MRRNRLRSCMAVLTAGFLLCLAGLRCTIKKPVSPSWDVRFEVPLVDEKYSMRDLDEDSGSISIDSATDEVLFEIDRQTKAFPVGDYLVTKAAWNETGLDFTGLGALGDSTSLSDTLVLRNDLLIESAVFDSGDVVFTVDNQTGYFLDLQGEVPSLMSENQDVPFEKRLPRFAMSNLPPGQTLYRVNLYNVTFKPKRSGDTNFIPYQGTVTLRSYAPGSGKGSRVSVRVDLSRVRYQRVTGWLNNARVSIHDNVDTGIKNSDKLGAASFASAQLTLGLRSDVRFPATFHAAVSGTGDGGRTASVSVDGSVGAADSVTVGPVEVAPLLNLWPKSLDVNGTVFIGDGSVKAEITNRDSIRARVRVRVPFVFSLPDTMIESKVDTIEMKEKARERIRKDISTVRLVLKVENHLPLGFLLETFFSGKHSDASIYRAVADVVRDTLDVPAAPVSGSPGTVRESASSREMTIGLSKDEVDVFDAERVFWGVRFTFSGTDGTVRIRPDDYIRLSCRIETDVRADFEDDGEGGGP